MTTAPDTGRSGGSSPDSDLRDLQSEALPIAIGVLALIAGLAMVHTPASRIDLDREKLLGASLLLLSWAAWRLLRRSYQAAGWLLVSGLIAAIAAILRWYPIANAGALLALPCLVAIAFLGTGAGVACAVAASMVALWQGGRGLAGLGQGSTLALLGTIWGATGLAWLALRPLRTVATWSWLSYQQVERLLAQARERQVELHEIREDLEDANRQLARLNRLATANQQIAEEARRAKETFVANVSHELRTPLNMIIGFSEMITQAPRTYGRELPRELLADVAAIQRNAAHLSRLVNDVLDLSKADSGYFDLDIQPCCLQRLIAEAVQAVQALFAPKGLYLHTDVPAGLPEIPADPTRIRQILLNLLSNAGRFTQQGGVRVTVQQRRTEVVVAVGDTGPGISEQDKAHLFEPFRQLDTPYLDRHEGTGLGLSISKKLVELHGGRMWLESDLGAGTTFYFSLPLQPPAGAEGGVARWFSPYWRYEARTRSRRAPVPEVRPRLVFVDPEGSLAPLAGRYLEGVDVALAGSVDEALAALSSHPAQALVLNDVAPAGPVSWRQVLPRLPFNIPVISCRAPGMPSAAGRLGVLKCLVKPVTREDLLQAVESIPHPVNTILVVDDEPEALQLFARMLTSDGRGYHVLRAADGQRALEILRASRPDLLLLDLVMPGMDGYQVLADLRGDPDLGKTSVITVSAQDPIAEPPSSECLTLSRPGGLSFRDLLDAVGSLAQALSPAPHTADRGPVGTPGD